MKLQSILLTMAMSLALLLVGCSSTPPTQPIQEALPEASASTSVEDAAPEGDASAAPEVEAPEADASEMDAEDPALSAYRDLLTAAPAIDGEHEELMDAAFGYEENQEMFGAHYDCFALWDINKDGTPELLAQSVVNFRWASLSIFTYADGQTVLLTDPANAEAHGTFEQQSTANGAYLTYFCDENHIHSVWRGTTPMGDEAEEDSAYTLEGTVLAAAECSVGESENTVYFSDIAVTNTTENVEAMAWN